MENYSEILTDYINGSLDPQTEDKLFSALSADPGLRDEFNRYISINSALKSSSDSYVPPASVTNNIFSEVGFTPLSPENITPKPGKYAFFKSRLFTSLGTGLLAVALTLWITGIFSSEDKQKEDNFFKEHVKQEFVISLPDAKENKPDLTDTENIPVSKSVEEATNNYTAYNQTQNNGDQYDNYNEHKTEKSRNIEFYIKPISLGFAEKQQNNIFESTQGKPSLMQPGDVSAIIYNNLSNLNFRLELIGSYTRNIPEATIGPANISDLNNLSFSAFYVLSEMFDLGAGIRQETFFTNYTGTEEELLYEYEQQPNFTTYELKARFYPLKSNYFKPFIEATAGANSEGFLWRASMGSRINIYNGLGMIMGISYDRFYFNHQSEWFDAQKACIYVGLSYGF